MTVEQPSTLASTVITQLGSDIDGEATNDQSGQSVAISADGTRVAIGAYTNQVSGSYSGHVRVYSWNGSSWTQTGLDLDSRATREQFGWSVAISADGNRVAVGVPGTNGNGVPGQVRVYTWNGSSWAQTGSDIS
ncbi:MAG: hypothetical protein FJW98_09605 [Actinobacteria bacterium]|nr:hypothetical protein [Actinomycetota bacterium]